MRLREPNCKILSMRIDCVQHGDPVVSLTVTHCSLKGASSVLLSWPDASYASYKSFLLQSAESLRCRASNNVWCISQTSRSHASATFTTVGKAPLKTCCKLKPHLYHLSAACLKILSMKHQTYFIPPRFKFPLCNLCALILAKWFPIVDTETQGCKVSAGIALAQFEGQNLNSLHPFVEP